MKDSVKLGVIIGIALIISSIIFGLFFYKARLPQNTIKVVGISSKIYEADLVKWKITLEETTGLNDVRDGYKRLKANSEKLISVLNLNGIMTENINIKPINIYKDYGSDGVTGYRLQQNLYIISNMLEEVENLALDPTKLLEKDVLIQNSYLEYFYSGIDDLKKEIIANAAVNARERAEKMLENTDVKVGKLVSLRSGVFQITEPFSTQVSSGGLYDTSTRKKQIKVTAHATFKIK